MTERHTWVAKVPICSNPNGNISPRSWASVPVSTTLFSGVRRPSTRRGSVIEPRAADQDGLDSRMVAILYSSPPAVGKARHCCVVGSTQKASSYVTSVVLDPEGPVEDRMRTGAARAREPRAVAFGGASVAEGFGASLMVYPVNRLGTSQGRCENRRCYIYYAAEHIGGEDKCALPWCSSVIGAA
ncbi:hypothetical protein N658DRAFT_487635 [Parathielavia hyrcaniae]|uniref:Uncharacterized protein n=1 Tax=Parathielavia hyrcaniae TaxID=113614 RepID=A0AAN6Q1T2_9PEZI|nr:hypothetical protein N658DRAFT_487635 [Parathielavia hyrcaniae]